MNSDHCRFSRGMSVLIIVLAMTLGAHGATLLRWKLVESEQYRLQIVQNSKRTTGDFETIQVSTLEFTWKVDQVDEQGHIHLSQTLDRAAMSIQAPGVGTVNYASDAKQESDGGTPLAEVWKPALGIATKIVIDELGNVVTPTERSPRLGTNQLLNGQYGESISRQFLVLPEEVIEPEFQWAAKHETNLPMKNARLISDRLYTYKGVEKVDDVPLERIEVRIDTAFDPGPSPSTTIQLVQQDGSGVIHFDAATGRLVKSELKQNWAVRVGDPSGETVQQQSATHSSISLTPFELTEKTIAEPGAATVDK